MVRLSLKDKMIYASIEKSSQSIFSKEVMIMRECRFRYNPATHEWVGFPNKKESLKEKLEEIDEVIDTISDSELLLLSEGTPEQKYESERRLPDYNLLNYEPIEGKSPHENFQKIAITKGINTNRYCFFYGMGSGKSYILAAIIAHRLYKYHDCSKVLIITTNIGVMNLMHEMKKFIKDLPDNKIVIADKDYRHPFDEDNDADIVVTSYNSFRLICEYYKAKSKISCKKPRKPFLPIDKWAKDGKVMLALDESHNVANPTSLQSHYVALHSDLFEYKYLFSGTPADKPEKQWQQFNIIDPYLVYGLSFSDWKEKMAYIGDRFSMYSIRAWKEEELKKQNERFLKSYGEYFKTDDLVTLPNYNEKTIYIDMNPNHRFIYESMVIEDLKTQRNIRDTVNRFPYMMLAVDDPHMLEKHSDKFDQKLNKLISGFKNTNLRKYDALADIVADHPDEKILVWVIHPTTAQRICERFKNLNPVCIIGDTDQKERFDLVEDFKKDKSKRMLVANITTLNTSVTILEAHVSVYFERGFNYTEYSQSKNRNYRIGQDSDIENYILVYNNSLDVLLSKNLDAKGKLVEGLCSKDFLSQEDWSTIFNCGENSKINY